MMNPKDFGTIIQIDNCLISEEVVTEYFACDYDKCHGACCVVGDSGAPLREEETEFLERDYDIYSEFMTKEGRDTVEKTGFFELDRDGDLVTPTVKTPHKVAGLDYLLGAPDGLIGTQGFGECAFIHFAKLKEGTPTSCLCAIEKCYLAGKTKFRKPISCSLYPIRITKLSNGMDALNLHRWSICSDAYVKGAKEKTRVYQFLKEPLISMYGTEFYDALCAAAEHVIRSKSED